MQTLWPRAAAHPRVRAMRHYQDQTIVEKRRYRERPGAYAVILDGHDLLATEQVSQGELQLPGGGIDPGESPLRALHREVFEETGWRIAPVRRLGAFQRYAYMPEYDLWARQVCHVYLARAVRRLGPPAEADHRAVWMRAADAPRLLSVAGDAVFAARALGIGA